MTRARKTTLQQLKVGDLVEIYWMDAISESEWTARDRVKWPTMNCKTTGYYLQHNDDAVMLVDSLFEDYQKDDGEVGGVQTIPRKMITRIELRHRPKEW